MRIAVLADVHGNLAALEAVVAHLERQHPDIVVNLGDLVSGPFDPAGCADLLMRQGYETIAGNHERQLLAEKVSSSDAFAETQLTQSQFDWIAGLPPTLALADGAVFACHGSPAGGDMEYLLEDVSSGRPMLDSEEAIQTRLAGIGNAHVVLCGHTHVPRIASVGGVLIVNPGSVGLPAFSDELPVAHIVESGAPHARYALIEQQSAGWAAELFAVPFDFALAAEQAMTNGHPEIAYSMRTGRWPSR